MRFKSDIKIEEKIVECIENQYIKEYLNAIKFFLMHNVSSNLYLFLDITESVFKPSINADGNFKFYPRPPKLFDYQAIALSITAESIGVDSENYLFGKINKDCKADFPNLIHHCNFNRRRKILAPYLQQLSQFLADGMNQAENAFIVDSIPVPICRIAREKSSRFCRESFKTAPDKGYSAVNKTWHFGYKLHMVTSVRGAFNESK